MASVIYPTYPSPSLYTDIAQSSGVGVNSECTEQYQALKLKKSFKYIIYGLNSSNTEITVLKTSPSDSYDDFIADLPETECRWVVYDLEYETEGNHKANKVVFISWSPEYAKIKQKMLYASAGDALRRELSGIAAQISATEYNEVAYEAGTLSIKQAGEEGSKGELGTSAFSHPP
ncbi:actin depolymerizing factor [Aspergillus nomiae NRRL 13137]|uniref:Cofilin n=1 Tax=Aspergillus nomiae NRRL (strain ATCC 15546 / NRRL 13137 / CBS 260.88 / M93) TaxID=1509407 RepID=A0A0L1JIW8_ASPN3|nr:actin depolymerizing factor [Aspergillus nomiae NRRL 13137]KNG91710.1 actin depolymerizing factor [Aspergillus nomiae NRRL 13137]